MSKTQTPYFSFSGLAFQTPGEPIEYGIDLRSAMKALRLFVLGNGNQDEVMAALAHIEDRRPDLEEFCDDIRITFILDDCADYELKQRQLHRAYNRIVNRLNNSPISKWDV